MNVSPAAHPSAEDLVAFAVGKLCDADARAIAAHLESCPDCRQAAESAPGDSFVARVKAARPGPPRRRGTPAPGAAVPALPGLPPELAAHPRYRVLRELGR